MIFEGIRRQHQRCLDVKVKSSPGTRAQRRQQRRLTRDESRFHSGSFCFTFTIAHSFRLYSSIGLFTCSRRFPESEKWFLYFCIKILPNWIRLQQLPVMLSSLKARQRQSVIGRHILYLSALSACCSHWSSLSIVIKILACRNSSGSSTTSISGIFTRFADCCNSLPFRGKILCCT